MHTCVCMYDACMDMLKFYLCFAQLENGSKAVAARLVTKYATHKASSATLTDKVI